MTLSIYDLAIETFVPMLGTLPHLLNKAAEHAAAKQVDVATLITARLAPDMFPFTIQVKLACRHAVGATARLRGQEPPAGDDVQDNFEQLATRVKTTIEALQNIPPDAFDGAETRRIAVVIDPELAFDMTGVQFLRDWSLPNFHFHMTTAYDILRHRGVPLGKRDYMRSVGRYIRRREPNT